MMTTSLEETCAETVARQLRQTCRKLAVTEANVELFSDMAKNGVATDDVRSFVVQQREKQGVFKNLNKRVIKDVMKQKYKDACAVASRLRQKRHVLRSRGRRVFMNKDWKYETREIERNARVCKDEQRRKNYKKYAHCMRKQEKYEAEVSLPKGVLDYVEKINVFNDDIEKQRSSGPMVCSNEIILSKAERMFLEKGPKYMWRQELDPKEFMIDIEKMVLKENLSKMNGDEVTGIDVEETKRMLRELEAKNKMVYDKETGELDMGNMCASDY